MTAGTTIETILSKQTCLGEVRQEVHTTGDRVVYCVVLYHNGVRGEEFYSGGQQRPSYNYYSGFITGILLTTRLNEKATP